MVGFADSGPAGFDANDRVVFALTDNGNGTFTFNLNDQIDHNTADATGTGDAKVLALDLTAAFTAQDFDQDPLTLPAGTLVVNVQNDVPTWLRRRGPRSRFRKMRWGISAGDHQRQQQSGH